ncbi:uncharacterized protein LOC115360958 isoform X2 [Myripristis murdjan]|uniref:uncharacterized protein LOC115360958 isoform X2 n=1 Tax=Myripristis murdjan TaxID=586833 RepID=UPI001175D67F|nr:uncharacterized protein LOC115360958 isoform X2 [Myripristis murdjan]
MQTPGREILTQMSTGIEHSNGEKSEPPGAVDSMDAEMPPAASQLTDGSQALPQKVSTADADANHMKEGLLIGSEGRSVETLTFEDVQTITEEPQPHSHEAQQLRYDGQQDFTHDVESFSQVSASRRQGFEKTTEEKTSQETEAHFPSAHSNPLTQSHVNSSQTHAALSDTHINGIVKINESETVDTPSNTSDINMKSTDEHGDTHSSEECVAVGKMAELHVLHLSKETSEQENEPTAPDCGEYEKSKSHSKVNLGEKDASEIAQQPVGKTSSTDASLLHDVGSQASALFVCSALSESGSAAETSTANTVANEGTSGHQENMTNKTENVEGVELIQNKQNLKVPDGSPERDAETGSSKCNDKPLAKETRFGDSDQSSLLSNKKHRSCFEWAGTQRKRVSSRTQCDVSGLHGFVQASSMSELNTSGSGVFPGRSCTSTIPTLLKGKLNKDPSVVISASDLLKASSISGPTASFKRDQQGECKAISETFREAAAPDTESRAALSTGSSPVSTSSSAVSRLSWQTTSGHI